MAGSAARAVQQQQRQHALGALLVELPLAAAAPSWWPRGWAPIGMAAATSLRRLPRKTTRGLI